MTPRATEMLVCVYYRVAAGDSQRVISAVREFQRTLPSRGGPHQAQVLLRFDLPSPAPLVAPPDDRPESRHDPLAPGPPDPDADATVMETYRLALPLAGGPETDTVVRTFLATLEAAFAPHAGVLRGARHVELFAPCA